MTPISAPTGALPPAATSTLRRTPAPSASISMLALSVSISASTSPTLIVSPSFLLHLTTVPSSIVGDSLASTTLVIIDVPRRLAVENFVHGLDDPFRLRQEGLLQHLRVGHRHVGRSHADDRRIEMVEA